MSDEAPNVSGLAALVIDCEVPPSLARWWCRLIGGDVEVDADGDARLRTSTGLVIDFLHVPETKAVKNRLHIDLSTDDLAAATKQALALGATRADDVYSGGKWQVWECQAGLAPPCSPELAPPARGVGAA